MLWVYVLLTTVGVVAIVPTVLRAIDGKAADLVTGFIGFVGFFGGLVGLFCRQAGVGGWATLIAAAAAGFSAGALHPELLSLLRAEKKPELTHDES